ncbi:hypothetical protein LTR62_003821 [Meristemomyces frigidus]|uniref:ZZ-type domain-containing protein n=1 Tax=Meristemomyces frigidus TaxID=1508187 RepID=A0AAN7YK98_9PEZI|nr:hypothetical protein LTR62_003821 [Meristemomyces frigidus]
MAALVTAIPQDTLITIKISVNDSLKKLKLPLRELGANVLPDKLRQVLAIKPEQTVVFERFSDSAGGFITLDSSNPQVFKTLIRAAKAKLKLRLKATVTPVEPAEEANTAVQEPLVHSPATLTNPAQARDSMAFDRRSVGSGIFQFREARASQQTLVQPEAEASVPQPFIADNTASSNNLVCHSSLPLRTVAEPVVLPTRIVGHAWSVYCNECDKPMADAHYHCSICDAGDYDLCEECVESGKSCSGETHWLIKRFIQDGKVVNSTTARILPRMKKSALVEVSSEKPRQLDTTELKKEMPGAFAEDTKTLAAETLIPTRTCNSCVVVLAEDKFVHCVDCDDYDLCMTCHTGNKHGHHPGHSFTSATEETQLSLQAAAMLSAGRNVRHNAICDGCDKSIYGVRHKCLNCPDWDFCNDCVKDARHIHPRHRFAAIYHPIADQYTPAVRHFGIYCDGPLCSGKGSPTYITGVRFKCAVCDDTDFCASCEASPGNHHNRTHPLIKFKTPVRNVSITTENEDVRGHVRVMGDRREETAAAETNTATPVLTVAEIKPTEDKQGGEQATVLQPIPFIKSEAPTAVPAEAGASAMLQAHFVRDSVADGTSMPAGACFAQIWTIKNPGPHAWPAGCSVRYVGGDNMLNVDNLRPSSVSDIAAASESNIVGREVEVGEEVAFKVVLRAPSRVGDSISYWRLKAADGTPFGHRLWCDIKVSSAMAHMATNQPHLAPQVSAVPTPAHVARMREMQMKQQQMARYQLQQQQEMMARHRQTQCEAQQQQLVQQRAQTAAQQKQQLLVQQKQQMEQVRQQHVQSQSLQHNKMMEMLAQQRQTAPPHTSPYCTNALGAPPSYNESNDDLQSRLSMLRAEQQRRRQAQTQFMANQYAGPSSSTATQTEGQVQQDDHLSRKNHAKARVEHIKAKILRARDEQAQKTAAEQQKSQATEGSEEKVRKIIEEVGKDIEKEKEMMVTDEKMETSQMVFPKLDKESPASSTYQSATSSSVKAKAAYVENEAGEVEQAAVTEPSVASPSVKETMEFDDEDIEVLSATAGEESEEDDGFATDEEYEILSVGEEE